MVGDRAALLRNEGAPGNWLVIVPQGLRPGTTAEVTLADGSVLRRELQAGSSYLATEDPRLAFGLGDAERVDVRVRWPDGRTVELDAVAAGQILLVETP